MSLFQKRPKAIRLTHNTSGTSSSVSTSLNEDIVSFAEQLWKLGSNDKQLINDFISKHSSHDFTLAIQYAFCGTNIIRIVKSRISDMIKVIVQNVQNEKISSEDFAIILKTIYNSYPHYDALELPIPVFHLLDSVPDIYETILTDKGLLKKVCTIDFRDFASNHDSKQFFIEHIDFILKNLSTDDFYCASEYIKEISYYFPEIEHVVLEYVFNLVIKIKNQLHCDDILNELIIPMADFEMQGYYFKSIRENLSRTFDLIPFEDFEEFADILVERFHIPYDKVQSILTSKVEEYLLNWDIETDRTPDDYANLHSLLCYVKCAPDIFWEMLPQLLNTYGLRLYTLVCDSLPVTRDLAEYVVYCRELAEYDI